ncbi:MAG TPA: nitroreductase [Micromonosporaceae bacterium]|nr:nitroreductase [Micromonosporaceae bacterium]
MNTAITVATGVATEALARAAVTAACAPSIHNTQPWRWRVRDGVADLYADRRRQLTESDPDGRMMITSCGAALHHACVALTAQGFNPEVDRMPDAGDHDHLARVTVTRLAPVTPAETMRHLQTLMIRHTDRRPLVDRPLPDGTLDMLRSAAATYTIGLDPLDRDQVIELASAVGRAQRAQLDDPAGRAELDAWTGNGGIRGAGVPDANILAAASESTVPARDFGHFGALTGAAGHDAAARYAILYGLDDEPGTWLRAGEALSAVWLVATEHGIALVPLSAAAEAPSTRQELRRILAGVGYPCIGLRLGVADREQPAPPNTPRLPVTTTVDADAVRQG